MRSAFLQNPYLLLGCLSLLSHMLTTGHHNSKRHMVKFVGPLTAIFRDPSKKGQLPLIRMLKVAVHSNVVPPFHFHSPSLFQRTDCCPLLSPRVITLNRFKEFSIGASTHCIDFLLHSCIAANLVEKEKVHLKLHTNAQY